jgi:DNA processing protein
MSAAASQTTIALVALMKLRGVGRRAALRIIDRLVDESDACDEVMSKAERAKLPTSELREAWSKSEEELARSFAAGICAYSVHDGSYPERLKNIPDPPAVLFVKGNPRGLHASYSVAVVGTREPTAYGEKVARKSAATAVEDGFAIISGLAHGCDTLGHEGCLDAQGVGVAVMAHGLDKVYPAANRSLAQRLLDFGGCLVSEYPVGVTPMRTAFAERDRIQSGLSDGVLVIETDVKGGTMHTVRFSRDQKRALACIKHPVNLSHEDKTQGNQKLLADKWAEAIPDGLALKRFLDRLKLERGPVPEAPEPQKPTEPDQPQISMGF